MNNERPQPNWDPSEAITLEAIPLPRLVCWEGIIAPEVLAGMPPEEPVDDSTVIDFLTLPLQ